MNISARTRRSFLATATSLAVVLGSLMAAPAVYASEDVVSHRIVAPMAAVLKNTPVPKISGTVAVGSVLTVTPGAWGSGVALKYRWNADGAAVKGATASKFTLTASQVGKKLTVTVTGSKAGYASASMTSAATKAVPAAALKSGVVTTSGTAKAGQKLTAKPGSWTTGTTLKYQWFVGGVSVSNATAASYTVRPADVDRTIIVKVTGSKSGYATKTVASASTKKVVGKVYANCTLLNADYPNGIRKSTAKGDMRSGVLKPFYGTPFVSNTLYAAQSIARDADRDGIMCESR